MDGGHITYTGLNLDITSHTVCFWFKPATLTDFNQNLGYDWSNGFNMHSDAQGSIYAGNYLFGNEQNRLTPIDIPGNVLEVDLLNHQAFSFNGLTKEASWVKDGIAIASKIFTDGPTNPMASFRINTNVHGLIGEVMFFNTHKTPEQIAAIRSGSGDLSGLQLYWKLHEDFLDYSGNNYHPTYTDNIAFSPA